MQTHIDWDQGQLLGFFPDPKLDVQSVIIPQGSTLLLYTDGAFDAWNSEGVRYGVDCLMETVRCQCAKLSPKFM